MIMRELHLLLKKRSTFLEKNLRHDLKDRKANSKECMDLTPDLLICVANNVFAALFNI